MTPIPIRPGRALRGIALGALVAIGLTAGAIAAHANGAATPDTAQFHPVSPTAGDWAMNTTFGFLFSEDAGASWRWTCHEAVVGTVSITPHSWRSPKGDFFVSVPLGLAVEPGEPLWRTVDHGCSWTPVASLASNAVLAVAFDATGDVAFAAGTNAATDTALAWRSTDGGATFSAPIVSRAGRYFTSALVAPSDAQRVYLTVYSQSPAYAAILRSDDGGGTWNELPFAFSGQPATRLLAVSPTNADVVWLRNDAATDRVLVSTNGAAGFTERFTASADVVDFALTENDGRAWIAVRTTAGLWSAPAQGYAPFAHPGGVDPSPRCLAADGSTLFVCANPYGDPWAAAETQDGAATWTTAMTFARVIGPVSCPATTVCDSLWPGVDQKIHGGSPTPTPTPGHPGSGGKGCSCSLAGAHGGGSGSAALPGSIALALLLAAATATQRRRTIARDPGTRPCACRRGCARRA